MAQLVTDLSAWKGIELRDDPSWIVPFDESEVAEIDAALKHVRGLGLPLEEIGVAAFELPTLKAKLRKCVDDICTGRGFVVLRGLPVERYSDEEVETIFWGLGTYLGAPVRQNPKGELLGHVKDYGRDKAQLDVRGYETNAHLHFHTDSADIIGLLCLRKAKSGGLSSVVSSMAVYNAVVEKQPDLLPIFERGFQYIRREAAFSDSPVSPRRLPVFASKDGIVSCRYLRAQIEAAAVRQEKPLTAEEIKALDFFDSIVLDPEYRLDMDLEMGDIQLINNYTTLHSRTAFVDWPEPERKRHMLRLWLTARSRRPVADEFPAFNGYGAGQTAEVALSDTLALF